MKLKMLTGLCGPDLSLSPGDIYDPSDASEAVRLAKAGFAEGADDAAATELKAAIAAADKARKA